MPVPNLTKVNYSFPVSYQKVTNENGVNIKTEVKLMCEANLFIDPIKNLPVDTQTTLTFLDAKGKVVKGIPLKQADLHGLNQKAIKTYLQTLSNT